MKDMPVGFLPLCIYNPQRCDTENVCSSNQDFIKCALQMMPQTWNSGVDFYLLVIGTII
jgi:hypothetical protein